MPTNIPTIIQPPGGLTPQPPDTTLIQLGFNKSLRYDFVMAHSASIEQIFAFVPLGVSNGLSTNANNITMHALQAYNTLAESGYITTLALAYIPSSMVNQLSMDVRSPMSALYKNQNPSVSQLMSMIDPNIPILAGPASGTDNAVGTGVSNSAGSQGSGGVIGDHSSGGSGGPVNGTSIGIGVGAVAGAAIYGAAMFYVARRYKRRKAAHARSSSVQTAEISPNARYSSLEYMDRAGTPDSAISYGSGGPRSAGISRPIMTENSLGWR